MASKLLKKIGAGIKKVAKSKVGKIIGGVAKLGVNVAASVVPGGTIAKGLVGGLVSKAAGALGKGKVVQSLLGGAKSIAAAKKGLTAGILPKSAPVVALESKGLGAPAKNLIPDKKGLGAPVIAKIEKPKLMQVAIDKLKSDLRKKPAVTPAEKLEIKQTVNAIEQELKSPEYSQEFKESVSTAGLSSMAENLTVSAKGGGVEGSVDEDGFRVTGSKPHQDEPKGLSTGVKVGIGIGAAGILVWIGKKMGLIKI